MEPKNINDMIMSQGSLDRLRKKKEKTGWYENYSHVNPRTDGIDYLSRHEKRPWKSLSNLTIVTWLFMEGHNVWILDARE